MNTATTPRVSVIGAGPGGLTCARILQKHGIPATVYERDPAPDARNQGGSLDLHADDGQLALREAGLIKQFWKVARPEGQQMRRWDPAGKVLFDRVPDPDDLYKPEIDRGQLRDLLLGSLAPGTVHWGRALASVGGPAEGPRILRFTDGTSVETDLVIGADGAFSRVRPAVSAALPHYSGVTFTEAWFDDVEDRHPEISELVGSGSGTVTDGERALFAQRNSGGHIRVYIVRRAPADWITAAGLTAGDTAGIRAHLLDEFAGWAPGLRRMISDNDGPYADRPLYVLPAPHTWDHVPTVTLLGDAAHLMPPIGVGVNLAMLDAHDLALALATHPTVGDAVRSYEKTMLPRSNDLAEALADGADFLLEVDERPDGRDEARALQQSLKEHRGVDGTWDLTFRTGGGDETGELILATSGTTLAGTFGGRPITDGRVEGTTVRFTAVVTSPVRMKIKCTAELAGGRLSGTARSLLLSLPFEAVRPPADPSSVRPAP
ncbi:FAD-dependent monooxygenase [Streptomyces sp. SBST2-5]|uniref:Flavin-dependent monooxygenase n=1 Tax=Streptomyces composti TaxID=2720025 RepID=A0ABX1A846_9ACTN|nr:FAD-dependent oxidoreductase [Streptomyces sp. WAC 01438]NJP51591.1 FAD-dependent monooxygenase [Streptomyces composti]RSM93596.1 FAD-dependent oxidoreductase [Streptomyces sp. WAC 01420]